MGLNKPVDFSTAKLLKEKGFNKEVKGRYTLTNWNTAFKVGELFVSDYKINTSCIYAPTIAEVVMWLYEKREVWVSVIKSFTKQDFWCAITTNDKTYGINGCSFNSPTEAYKTAIDYTLNNLI